MSAPSVSVIVPAFRQKRYIARCLDSILHQTYTGQIETIVVDDGCPEGSGDIAEQHALRPRVVRQTNCGVARARNRGIAEARGEFIAFLDTDDLWYPRKLECQLVQLRAAREPALCFTRYRFVGPLGEALDRPLLPEDDYRVSVQELFRVNVIGCSTVVVHRRCLELVGGFPDSADLRRAGEDYALWLRMAVHFPLIYLAETLSDYTVHTTSRAGRDPFTNFEGAVHALRAFEQAEGPLRVRIGRSYGSLVLKRSKLMFQELRLRRSGIGQYLRAVRTLVEGLHSSPG